MEWTEQRIEMLRRLWGQGQTASQIAVALGGVTRNAVIGKAHRLGLTGRPSPINSRSSPGSSSMGGIASRGPTSGFSRGAPVRRLACTMTRAPSAAGAGRRHQRR